jgi:AcrR family transcriptional regulator
MMADRNNHEHRSPRGKTAPRAGTATLRPARRSTSGARSARPRWRRRKEARPAEIIAAALESFTEHGFAATRLEDVARRAGVTKGTMYLYFESKEALFKAVVRETVLPAIERGEQIVEEFEGGSRDLFATLVRRWWSVMGRPGLSGLPKLMISEAAHFPDLAQFYHEEVVQRGRRLMARVIERGIERGELRRVDPDYASRVLTSPVILAAIWKHSMVRCEPGAYDFDRYIDIFIDLALDGLAGAGGMEVARA